MSNLVKIVSQEETLPALQTCVLDSQEIDSQEGVYQSSEKVIKVNEKVPCGYCSKQYTLTTLKKYNGMCKSCYDRITENESVCSLASTTSKKEPKKSIPKRLKTLVWDTYIDESIVKHRCLCCKRAMITNRDFHVGHVVSEKEGGESILDNLRPICHSCNYSMGAMNMVEFIKKCGFYI